tara:strand:- start:49 stop:684 length:636 start_codon:yes stop_codon:yes gene_type:complete
MLKNKTAAKHKLSNRRPHTSAVEKHWMPHGPFGSNKTVTSVMLHHGIQNKGQYGFATNDTAGRSLRYIGKTSAMSAVRTPFRGVNPVGHGGFSGQYYNPPINEFTSGFESRLYVRGNQYKYKNPALLSSKAMINRRFGWLKHQYHLKKSQDEPISLCRKSVALNIPSHGEFISHLHQKTLCSNDDFRGAHPVKTHGDYIIRLQKRCIKDKE